MTAPTAVKAANSGLSLESRVEQIVKQADALLADPAAHNDRAMPGRAFFLDDNGVLAQPRDGGDSRYPYGGEGFNFWVYASGYMHSNEGLFSQFLRAAEGQEPNIAFFGGVPNDSGRYTRLPLLSVPRMDEGEADSIRRFSVLTSRAAYFITEGFGIRYAVRVFVAANKDICFSLLAKNLTNETKRCYLSSYMNPFLRNQLFESGEDRWFKEISTLDAAGGGKNNGALGGFLVKVNEDKDRTSSITHYGVINRSLTFGPGCKLQREERTTSRYEYVGGTRGSLHTAAALAVGTFGEARPLCTFVETSIAGDLLHLALAGGEGARLEVVFGAESDAASADRRAKRAIDPPGIDAELVKQAALDASRHKTLAIGIGQATDKRLRPKVFTGFLEHLKRQVEFCALLKGYVQLSVNSLIGIRDVFQALEALAYWQPASTRAKMLEALGYTAPDGRCFRQYSLPTTTGNVGRMDLRPFIDQGAWVISAIVTYLRVTGDRDLLDEACGYHEIIDEATATVKQSDKRDSVLEHMIKILDYMLHNRDHEHTRCVLALYGDWNDALDGLGISDDPSQEYGTGVSVMATLQVYENCIQMVELLESIDPKWHADRIKAYKKAAAELAEGLEQYAIVRDDAGDTRIVHGWGDGRKYLVGGFNDPDGQPRDGLTSNAFWVLSGMYDRDPEIAAPILAAFNRLDSKYGFKTFEPCFADDAPGVGRIRKLPPGTAENGASYIHATAFAIMALFRMGKPREAWEQLYKILPFTDGHENLSHSPFVMPNSYGHNPEKFIDGQNMNDWQTGSSNVVLKLLIRYVFGFEPELGGLWVQPAAWAPFKSYEYASHVGHCQVRVKTEYRNGGQRRFAINGQTREGVAHPTLGVNRLWIPSDQLTQDAIEVHVVQDG